jgi:alpha/beta superfamily hydrolase
MRAALRDIVVEGPAGPIQGVLESPPQAHADAVAVLCHPHPLYHGTMNNKVVHTLARAVNSLGRRTVRFNFRGVGESAGAYADGIGETEDVLSVIGWARDRWPAAELWLGGFSFGAFVALRASAVAAPACLVTVAPPIQRFPVAEQPRPSCPWLIVQGEDDELVDCRAVYRWAAGVRPRPEIRLMPDTDHLFHGRLTPLRRAATEFLLARAPACDVA